MRKIPVQRRKAMMETLGYGWHPLLPRGRAGRNIARYGTRRPTLYVRKGSAGAIDPDPIGAFERAQGWLLG